MKINERVTGSRFIFSFINEWEQFFGHYNWKNWNWCLIQFMYENDIILGAYELQIILLGLGMRIRYNKPIKTEEMLKLEAQVKEYQACVEAGVDVPGSRDWEDIRKELFGNCCPRCCYKLDGSEDEKSESTE